MLVGVSNTQTTTEVPEDSTDFWHVIQVESLFSIAGMVYHQEHNCYKYKKQPKLLVCEGIAAESC